MKNYTYIHEELHFPKANHRMFYCLLFNSVQRLCILLCATGVVKHLSCVVSIEKYAVTLNDIIQLELIN